METVVTIPEAEDSIGFCADIHGALGNVLTMTKMRPDIKYWFCAGDVVDMYKAIHDNQPTLRLMHRLGIPSVLGNHDYHIKQKDSKRLDEEAKTYLMDMPFSMALNFADIRIRIFHATPKSRDDFIAEEAGQETFLSLFGDQDGDMFILGHTHTPYSKRFLGREFINPGALGISGIQPSFCVLDKHGQNEIIYLE